MAKARAILLGANDDLTLDEQVWVYRVLGQISPLAYLPHLVRALIKYGEQVPPDLAGARLAIWAEALDAARRLDPGAPARAQLLEESMDCHQGQLRAMGRGE